jgi:hypothetical protein
VWARNGKRGKHSLVWQIVHQGVEMPDDGEEDTGGDTRHGRE